jgi:hypothetical protein
MKPVFILDPRAHLANLCTHAEVVYLEPYVDKLNWIQLSKNPNAMPLILQHVEERKGDIDWWALSKHPSIMSILANDELFHIFEKEVNMSSICDNPNALPFLKNNLHKIDWYNLCENPDAISLIEQHPENINWHALSINPNALHLLRHNQEKIHWGTLCWNINPEAITLLDSRIKDKTVYCPGIYWSALSHNPNALHLLEKYPDKIEWNYASMNPDILPLLEKNIHKIVWSYLCIDKITVDVLSFLEKHLDKLCPECWSRLSGEPVAIPLLEKYPEHIRWDRLSLNPGAIPLLEAHPDKIDWNQLSVNPAALHLLFRMDHETMRQSNELFKEELIAYVFEPERLMRFSAQYNVDFRTYLQMY